MDDLERELKTGFLDEAAQLLSDSEQCFLDLEKASGNPATVEKLFRLAHNLKGSAGAVGFTDLMEFTHKLESLLLKIKNKEIAIATDTVNLLLRCNDRLREIVEKLRENLEARFDNRDLMASIESVLSGSQSAKPKPQAAPPAVAPFAAEPPVSTVPTVPDQMAALTASYLSAPKAPEIPQNVYQFSAPEQEPSPPAPAAPAIQAAPKPEKQDSKVDKPDESIRVSLTRLDRLMNNVGELVILQTVLAQHKQSIASALVQKTIGQLEKISKEIQDISMSLRMVPLKQTFQKMHRIVRDTSKALGKEVALEISGEDTELDKTVLERIGDPLVHLIRNAVDHGVESAQDRLAAGKPASGKVSLSAFYRGGHLVIEVSDDGAGLDAKKLTQKAIEKGIIRPDQKLSDREAYDLIFAPGFSTKVAVTDISGRGVGMDVVKTNITQLQGEVHIQTELGKGTTFEVLLPLTLSIIDGMVVTSHSDRFVVPIAHVHESFQPKKEDISLVTEVGEVLNLRGESLPLYRLSDLLSAKCERRPAWESIAIVVRGSKQKPFSVLVDDIIAQQQVVIKRLGDELDGVSGIAGGAILGDGRAALILDLPEMIQAKRALRDMRGAA